jgi:glycine/D-amino acid oxidase-like deaminating enzyme
MRLLRDLTNNLQHLREWNDHRKKTKKLKLVMKSCVNFTLAGKRYKAGVLSAAKHAKELQKKGIDWHNISAEDICQQERGTAASENTSA